MSSRATHLTCVALTAWCAFVVGFTTHDAVAVVYVVLAPLGVGLLQAALRDSEARAYEAKVRRCLHFLNQAFAEHMDWRWER